MSWFTVKVKYTKHLEDGRIKRVNEPYLLQAENFTDAEAKAHEEVGAMVRGEFDVVSITRTEFHEIVSDLDADTWFKCKITFEDTVDEKPKKISHVYLVSGETVNAADARLKEHLKDSMLSFEVQSVVLSPIVDIINEDTINAEVQI
jgi:hypothetical protein